MREFTENERQAINYLLGAMNDETRDEFEERLFLNEDLSFAVESAEKDLIDEYLRGELNADEKGKFENNFLITDSRREKLQIAGILNRKLLTQKEVAVVSDVSAWEKVKSLFAIPNLALAGSAAAIVLFLILAGVWISRREDNQQIAGGNQNAVIENREVFTPTVQPTTSDTNSVSNSNAGLNLPINAPNKSISPNQKTSSNSNLQKNVKSENPSPVKKPNPASSGSSILAFTLFPATRAGENPRLTIAPDVEIINLRVLHNNEDSFVRYRAELRNSDGETVWTREIPVSAKTKSKSISLSLNSKLFKSDLYELALLGVTPAGEYQETNFYNFSVRKK